ncbi:hypothetical protein Bbelb_388850 [Branchiostoma belcheri]|nr:hypothetical protein Bbelb_388850 [Branchiostoma belcheri]
MAEDLPSDAVHSVVRSRTFSDTMSKIDTETVPTTFRQVDEAADSYISGTCEENEHDDDEQLSTQSGAVFANRETIQMRPGDFDTYDIAYICKAHNTRIKKSVEETKSKPFQRTNTASSSRNDNDIHLVECGSGKNDTDTSAFNGTDGNMPIQARDPSPMYSHNTTNPYPMHTKNNVNPNLMYLQSTTEASNASPGYASSEISNSRTRACDPNPMYTHDTVNPYPMHAENDVNPNLMYLQSTTEASNASPGYASSEISNSRTRACDPNPMYTHDTVNPYPMHAENDVNPNLMYLQSTTEASNASPGYASSEISNSRTRACDPNPMYTHDTVNPYPMHAENDVNPNLMYLQSTTEASNASPGYASSEISNSRTRACDPNPMYTHDTVNPYPMHAENDVNPTPTYLQSTVEPSNAIPGSAFMSNTGDDIPCTLTSSDIHQQGDVHIYQYIPACIAALEDAQPELPLQNQPTSALNNINDVSSNPLSNGVPDSLNPNPTSVQNVYHRAGCGQWAEKKVIHTSL